MWCISSQCLLRSGKNIFLKINVLLISKMLQIYRLLDKNIQIHIREDDLSLEIRLSVDNGQELAISCNLKYR